MTKLELVASIALGWMGFSTVLSVVVGKIIRFGMGPEPSAGFQGSIRPRPVTGSFPPSWRCMAFRPRMVRFA